MAPDLRPKDVSYSLRRYFVDEFFCRHVPMLPSGGVVLDVGGVRTQKRGQFDIGQYDLSVVYANCSPLRHPDVQADAAHLPLSAERFDAAICSELLEHVPEPMAVVEEIYRVLKPGGVVLICVPFLYPMHPDPFDYGRYTDLYWRENLTRLGFVDLTIEKQGIFWSVLMDALRAWIHELVKEGRLRRRYVRTWVPRLVGWGKGRALAWDARHLEHPFYSSFTTGFGIRALKS